MFFVGFIIFSFSICFLFLAMYFSSCILGYVFLIAGLIVAIIAFHVLNSNLY